MLLFNLVEEATAAIMQCLFSNDISKLRSAPSASEPTATQAIRYRSERWKDFHRTFHCSPQTALKTMRCTTHHKLKAGDTRHDYFCPDCAMGARDSHPRRHHNPDLTELESTLAPGKGWSLDGADLCHLSSNGFKYAINFVDMRSKLYMVYFTKSTNSYEFRLALEWLQNFVKIKTGKHQNSLQ